MKHMRTLKVIITVFHKLKKLSGDMEDILKTQTTLQEIENYNV